MVPEEYEDLNDKFHRLYLAKPCPICKRPMSDHTNEEVKECKSTDEQNNSKQSKVDETSIDYEQRIHIFNNTH